MMSAGKSPGPFGGRIQLPQFRFGGKQAEMSVAASSDDGKSGRFRMPWQRQETIEEPEEEDLNPIEQIKKYGIAGGISYVLLEGVLWTVGAIGGVVIFYFASGHWPDVQNPEDLGKLGAEAFAYNNLITVTLPIRVSVAVGFAPTVDEQIV